MQHLRLRLLAATLPFLLATPPTFAQQPAAPTREEATAALNPVPSAFTRRQLDQMLAPIALYPDQVLTALLMAATFPPQIVEAGKWLEDPAHAALKDDALAAALEPLPWDPSVKSLVPFPQVIVMLNDHLDWTEALGAAFANQQNDVMARVQFLRDRAVAAGQLKSTPQIAVSGGASDITIEPVDPAMVYLPVYNPAEAYGDWPDRDYPPVYIPPPPHFVEGAVGAGIGFSVGFGVVRPLWGWGHPDWRRHEVVVDRDRFTRITNATNITNNHTVIQNDTWRRTGPVAAVPEAQRPHPATAATAAPPPHGTVPSTAVVHLGRDRGPEHRDRPAAAAPAARPDQPPQPAAAATAPDQRHPGDHGDHRDEAAHAPNAAPAAPPRPAAAVPSPAAAPDQRHPGDHSDRPHRDEAAHGPGAAPPHAPAPAIVAAPPHPPASPPHPADAHPPAPAAAAAPPHSPASPPHPADAHPPAPAAAAAPPHPPAPAAAAQPHSPAAQPAAQAHPLGKPPEKKSDEKPKHKPGEPDHEQH